MNYLNTPQLGETTTSSPMVLSFIDDKSTKAPSSLSTLLLILGIVGVAYYATK